MVTLLVGLTIRELVFSDLKGKAFGGHAHDAKDSRCVIVLCQWTKNNDGVYEGALQGNRVPKFGSSSFLLDINASKLSNHFEVYLRNSHESNSLLGIFAG